MASRLLRYFLADFPIAERSRRVARLIAIVASDLDDQLAECAEKTAGMRKLLEARECFLRAASDEEEANRPVDLTA